MHKQVKNKFSFCFEAQAQLLPSLPYLAPFASRSVSVFLFLKILHQEHLLSCVVKLDYLVHN